MKTVGIITYHYLNNYGTMLQALALQHKIKLLGYDSQLIDYRFQELQKRRRDILKIRLKRFFIYTKEFHKYYTKYKNISNEKLKKDKFDHFYKKYIVTSPNSYNSLEDLMNELPKYDVYLVGSDQTWNPNVGNSPKAFFLPFAPKDKVRASYAPSVGVNFFNNIQKKEMKERLENVDFLSCRENIGSKLIHEITGRSVKTVLDPTLLLSREEWASFESLTYPQEPYILQYFLGDVKESRDFTTTLSKKTGYPIVCLPHSYIDMASDCNKKFDVDPADFLSLIKNAAFICTDSFHGTAFSINYQKNFFSFTKRRENELTSDNSRLHDILNRLDLSDRLINDYKLPDKRLEIDYTKVNEELEALRKESMNYLQTVLSKGGKE